MLPIFGCWIPSQVNHDCLWIVFPSCGGFSSVMCSRNKFVRTVHCPWRKYYGRRSYDRFKFILVTSIVLFEIWLIADTTVGWFNMKWLRVSKTRWEEKPFVRRRILSIVESIPVPGHFQQTTSGEGFPPRSIARKINMNIEYLDFLKVMIFLSTVVTHHSLVPYLVNMFGTFSKHHSEEYLGLSCLHIDHGYMALQWTADVAIPCTTLRCRKPSK